MGGGGAPRGPVGRGRPPRVLGGGGGGGEVGVREPPKEYTKPLQTIQSPNGIYEAPTDYTKPQNIDKAPTDNTDPRK